MKPNNFNDIESSIEVGPMYPVDLLGNEEIHKYIPHLPVYRTLSDENLVCIPFGDYENTFQKLGILVTKNGDKNYDLDLLHDDDIPYPNSINDCRKLSSEIGLFCVDTSVRNSNKISIYSPEGDQIDLKKKYSRLMSRFLIGAIHNAYFKNRRYSSTPAGVLISNSRIS